jgi:alkyl sulfatase BDS1-like metallo-beta-lactamase superfamily hydrolase
MTTYDSASHPLVASCAWDPVLAAERVNDHVLMSRGTSNSYLVTCGDRDLVVNTGTGYQGRRHRERYEQLLGRSLNVAAIVFTQSHDDHFGGWHAFAGPGAETIAGRDFTDGRAYRALLPGFFAPRSGFIVRRLMPHGLPDELLREMAAARQRSPVQVTTLVDDRHELEVGGRRIEILAVPGGETTDGIAVWMPAERTAFIGNLDGAIWGQLPHLYTIRGDRQRSARLFIASIERILALEPELLITGHDEPIAGAAQVRQGLTRIRDATAYIHDRTVEGMNEGRDLWTLMREIRLPADLQPAVNRGPVHWYVRAIWEEYAGWFRFESPTELYGVPPASVRGDLLELAGGPDRVAERALEHAAAGRPLEALHLAEIALSGDGAHVAARRAQIAALERLHADAGNDFDELAYLEDELARARAALP